MAKKLNKLMARVAALEKTIAGLLSGKPARRKAGKKKKPAAKAKPQSKAAKPARAKRPAAKKKVAVKKSAPPAPVSKPKKRPARKARTRVPAPGIAQIAPSGIPDFVQPLDKV